MQMNLDARDMVEAVSDLLKRGYDTGTGQGKASSTT